MSDPHFHPDHIEREVVEREVVERGVVERPVRRRTTVERSIGGGMGTNPVALVLAAALVVFILVLVFGYLL